MRLTTALFAVALAPVAAFADPAALSKDDVTARLKPVTDDIAHCYLDRAASIRGAGKLSIELDIARSGALRDLSVKTPGLPSRLAKQIDGCIREAIATVSFPARKTFTTATVPYFFQHTAAPGAGPLLSCYAATGCH